jgi:hypothetical protein
LVTQASLTRRTLRGSGKFQQYLHERGPFTDRNRAPVVRQPSTPRARPGDRYPELWAVGASRDAPAAAQRNWIDLRSKGDVEHRRDGRRLLLWQGRRGPDRRGQAPKGTGGMPRRHQDSGVEGCEKSGGAAQRASSPEYPRRPGELKHLSTRRKRNQPRLPQ